VSSVEPFRPRVVERVTRSPEFLGSETLERERSHECETKKKQEYAARADTSFDISCHYRAFRHRFLLL